MNHQTGKVAKNAFIEQCIEDCGFRTAEEAAVGLDISEDVLVALMYSPLPVLEDAGLAYIAAKFGYTLEDWFFHWRMGMGKVVWDAPENKFKFIKNNNLSQPADEDEQEGITNASQ